MDYFTQIQQTIYPNLENDGASFVTLTNILTRSAFLQEVLDNTSVFYEYQVKDGETAEIIADKLYGDPKRFWIVLLFNKLNNPYYDFPLTTDQLHSMIENKYDQTVEESQTTLHHYEDRVTTTVYYNGIVDSETEERFTISAQYQNPNTGLAIDRPSLPTVDGSIVGESTTQDFGAGVTVTTAHLIVALSNYTYELEENEKRRSIKLLDAGYVGVVENEFRRLMANGN